MGFDGAMLIITYHLAMIFDECKPRIKEGQR